MSSERAGADVTELSQVDEVKRRQNGAGAVAAGRPGLSYYVKLGLAWAGCIPGEISAEMSPERAGADVTELPQVDEAKPL
jgi:hypothetical protein